ncbi:MAG: hypothetical protein IT361_08355 [Gemmatimonadaceae bacterium]|nr:hypothetical protein [Gemmatimonadaceae bacterium]
MTLRRSTFIDTTGVPAPEPLRRGYRPPIGIPARDDHRREATIASLALHALLIVIVVFPPLWLSRQINATQQLGPSGNGRVGGGGGGNRGTGGEWTRESLRYFQIPEASPSVPIEPLPIPPPVPPPEAVKPPPPAPIPKSETMPPTSVDSAAKPGPTTEVASAEAGKGGGSGKDGTAGSGPGTGGGVGSGTGTGRGSGTGDGTGNGNDDSEIYPPAVIALPILPLPVPNKVRPYKLVAYFEVDTLGNSRLLSFNPSSDGGYNKRIREMLSEIRFRPAVRGNGRPVLDTAIVTALAPRT